MSPAGAVARVDEEMSQNQAGRYYLDSVCDYNVKGDRYNEVLFPGDTSGCRSRRLDVDCRRCSARRGCGLTRTTGSRGTSRTRRRRGPRIFRGL